LSLNLFNEKKKKKKKKKKQRAEGILVGIQTENMGFGVHGLGNPERVH